jgi:hypothetical protein
MTKVCSEEACEEVIIPSGDFAFEAQRVFLKQSKGGAAWTFLCRPCARIQNWPSF